MTRVIMHGCNGRMGKMICSLAADTDGIEIVAGVDAFGDACDGAIPFFNSIDACDIEADALIDFSNAKAADAVMDYCLNKKLPLVFCTTGLDDAQLAKLADTAKSIPVLRSANMSVGVNVVLDILKEVAPKLYAAGFDIDIVEKHHRMKLDAPSGTAVAMADEIRNALDESVDTVYDRSERRAVRPHAEIGVSAVRGGTIVGDHDVIFAGTDEVVTISHRAYSRAVFAKGALTAAAFLAGKPAGMYSMRDALA